MTLKNVSTVISLLTIIVSTIYNYYLLSFIDASGGLWMIWILSIVVASATTLVGLYTRDEFYNEQFKHMLKK